MRACVGLLFAAAWPWVPSSDDHGTEDLTGREGNARDTVVEAGDVQLTAYASVGRHRRRRKNYVKPLVSTLDHHDNAGESMAWIEAVHDTNRSTQDDGRYSPKFLQTLV